MPPFPAFTLENGVENGYVRKGTGRCIFQIIPLIAVILQGKATQLSSHYLLSSTRELYSYQMSCNDMQPEEAIHYISRSVQFKY